MSRRPNAIARPLETLLATTALGVVAASALGLLADSFWMLELITHFRLQLLAVQLSLLVVFLWRRRWLFLALIVPFAVVNATFVAPYWPSEDAIDTAPDTVELMAVNLYGGNSAYSRFVDVARREQPDVLLLLEYNSRWDSALTSLSAEYPHQVVADREDFFGMALLSRIPLKDADIVDLLGVPAIVATLERGSGDPLRFVGVHLEPPMSAREARQRNAQLDLLGEIAAAEPRPLIVAGDFNATPYSPVLAGWLDRTGLRDARRGRGFGMSWPVAMPVLGIPIDHVLVSEDFLVAAHYYGAAFGSDHYPVVTRLALRGKQ